MIENRSGEIVNRIIEKTKTKEIEWERLNKIVKKKGTPSTIPMLNLYLREIDEEIRDGAPIELNEDGSFYAFYNAGYMYLFDFYNEMDEEMYYILGIQANLDATIVRLKYDKSMQKELRRLKNLIQEQINNIDSYIDNLLK